MIFFFTNRVFSMSLLMEVYKWKTQPFPSIRVPLTKTLEVFSNKIDYLMTIHFLVSVPHSFFIFLFFYGRSISHESVQIKLPKN